MAVASYDPNVDSKSSDNGSFQQQSNIPTAGSDNTKTEGVEEPKEKKSGRENPTGFTNLSKYIEANRGRQQELTTDLKNNVADVVGGARESISSFTKAKDQAIADTPKVRPLQNITLRTIDREELINAPQQVQVPRMTEAQQDSIRRGQEVKNLAAMDNGLGQLAQNTGIYEDRKPSLGKQRLDSILLDRGGVKRDLQQLTDQLDSNSDLVNSAIDEIAAYEAQNQQIFDANRQHVYDQLSKDPMNAGLHAVDLDQFKDFGDIVGYDLDQAIQDYVASASKDDIINDLHTKRKSYYVPRLRALGVDQAIIDELDRDYLTE